MATQFKSCSVDNCNRNADRSAGGTRGYCNSHYRRLKKHGDPVAGRISSGERLRFITEVALPHESDECLVWPYGRDRNGYGQFRHEGVSMGPHRYICIVCHGEPGPIRMEASHSCGKGHLGCVNPKHIRWATPKENNGEKVEHGTLQVGSKHHQAKLTEENVLKIKELRKQGLTLKSIAYEFGVSDSTIGMICSQKRWGKVFGDGPVIADRKQLQISGKSDSW